MAQVEKYSKSINIIKQSKKIDQQPLIVETRKTEVISRGGNSSINENRFTHQAYKKEVNKFAKAQTSLNYNRHSNQDSSFQRSTGNQTICTCGQFGNEMFSPFNATLNTMNSDHCICGETMNNRTIGTSERNIIIHDNGGFNSCNEMKIISNVASNYNEHLTDEEKSMCTCNKFIGQQFDKKQFATSSNEIQMETTSSEEKKAKLEQNEEEIINENIQATWSGDNYIQNIERLQYLAAGAPELQIQFLNDMYINPSVVPRGPIQVIIPLPENYIQKQDTIEVIQEEQKKYEGLCGENVDFLRISKAYPTPVSSFKHLEVQKEEIYIEKKEEIPIPLEVENHELDINRTYRVWRGVIKPIRICKLDINVADWNSLVQIELANDIEFCKDRTKRQKMFEDDDAEIEGLEKKSSKIDLGSGEFTTLVARKRILRKTEQTTFNIGGRGFYLWDPVPHLAESMTFPRDKEPEEKPKRDWNLLNDIVSFSQINILVEEKIITVQQVKPIEVLAEKTKKDKWNTVVKRQANFKLGYVPKKKKWILIITKRVNNLFFPSEPDDVIVNDDYNNVNGTQRRPVQATIVKISEQDDTSSVSSYDVFQHLIMKKNIDLQLMNNCIYRSNQYDYQMKKKICNGYKYSYIPIEQRMKFECNKCGYGMDERKNMLKFRKCENEQKNQCDTFVTKFVKNTTTTNIKNNGSELFKCKKEKFEIVKDEPEVKNYLII